MTENMYSFMTPPPSPVPLTITATTTLEDVINATILHPQTPDTTRTQPPTQDTSPAETRFDDALFSLLDSPRKQTKLTKNPMFQDLQAILKADCSVDATPNSLYQMLPTRTTTYSVATRELRLQQRLTRLSNYYPTQVTQLSSFHKYQASIVETDRYRELLQLPDHQPTLRTAINHYYDQMLHQIMDRVEISVGTIESLTTINDEPTTTQYPGATNSSPTQYQPTTNSASTQYPSSTNSASIQHPSTTNSASTQYPSTTNSASTQYPSTTNSASTQYHRTNSAPTQYQSTTNSATTQYQANNNSSPTQYQLSTNSSHTQYQPSNFSAPTQYQQTPTQHQPTSTQCPSSTQPPTSEGTYQAPPTNTNEAPFRLNLRTRPSLSKQAIRLMEVWYHANIDHPYPDTQDVEILSTAGRITEEQVKKWFANKRNRSRNIRPISQIVRRKRQIQAATNRVIRIPSLC